MTDIFVVSDNIFSPLGATTAGNFSRLKAGVSGVKRQVRPEMADQPFYAALFDADLPDGGIPHAKDGTTVADRRPTKFERLLLASVSDALQAGGIDPRDEKTILIVSTTKGNISLLEDGIDDPARLSLHHSARAVADHFQFSHTPLIVSNACISGILGLVTAMRLIRSGRYDTAVVTGADVISRFVLSGFGSFQAISPGPCRPFDRARDGINLGEGAATVILSSRETWRGRLRLRGGAVSNDANHISGPSRTGEELCQVIRRSMADAGCETGDIGFISAHGTATLYNDEMEARAITLAGLQAVPVNSLKGYYGHTLGAAGLIESVVTLQSMREDLVLPSPGFEENGVTMPLNICSTLQRTALSHCLKTASGFGGCNAAVVMSK